jgi:lipoate-protein ligase A
VDAAVARNDGPAGTVCFAGQQGADLRVGERKLCGSAQLRRDGAVLQHGSVLLARLPFDELDLVHPRPGDPPVEEARAQLRAATVTLGELGAPVEPRTVAEALVEGCSRALDLQFTSRVVSSGT